MTEGYEGTAIRRKVFNKFCLLAPSRRRVQSCIGSIVIATVVVTLTKGNGKPTIGEKKQKQIGKMFQTDWRRSLREAGGIAGVCHTIVWAFSHKTLKMFPYHVQIGEIFSNTDKENSVAFAEIYREMFEENPSFLQGIVFSEECSFHCRMLRTNKTAKSSASPTRKLSVNHRGAL